ncbi:MAG: hypothetical protein M1820_002907 [Bogoriella megaspora]|nr:MAG: hypothetical protein M1820_002907 [Bogoriella megaspora]
MDRDEKILRQKQLAGEFPKEYSIKVDRDKVNMDVIKVWIQGEINKYLEYEDDIVFETCYNMLVEKRFPDIKRLQITLSGLLSEDKAKTFCKDLWGLCVDAQAHFSEKKGVPTALLEQAKQKVLQLDKEKAEATNLQDRSEKRGFDLDREQRDRAERGRGRGRGGRGGRDYSRYARRSFSRSPPRRRENESRAVPLRHTKKNRHPRPVLTLDQRRAPAPHVRNIAGEDLVLQDGDLGLQDGDLGLQNQDAAIAGQRVQSMSMNRQGVGGDLQTVVDELGPPPQSRTLAHVHPGAISGDLPRPMIALLYRALVVLIAAGAILAQDRDAARQVRVLNL